MLKKLIIALTFLALSSASLAEEGGEHAEKKPPPKPPASSPVRMVLELPVVVAWQKWSSTYKSSTLTAWGEYLNTIEGKKCWEVAVGEMLPGGKTHVWRRFCAPIDGGEVWVESNSKDPNADLSYMAYGRWVNECKPTENSEGTC